MNYESCLSAVKWPSLPTIHVAFRIKKKPVIQWSESGITQPLQRWIPSVFHATLKPVWRQRVLEGDLLTLVLTFLHDVHPWYALLLRLICPSIFDIQFDVPAAAFVISIASSSLGRPTRTVAQPLYTYLWSFKNFQRCSRYLSACSIGRPTWSLLAACPSFLKLSQWE